MKSLILPPDEFLDHYILNIEFSRFVNISKNVCKFWKKAEIDRCQDTRAVFLHKNCILKKHQNALKQCTDLSGFALANAFCSFMILSPPRLVEKNNSAIYKLLELEELFGVRFVNLKKSYDSLKPDYHQHICIEEYHFFSPTSLERRIKITPSLCVGYY